ncbi:hypothetical protein BDZ89DRAFT_1057364 [Hymenopellis radicata]|nr:hypothetical protein BDZ89DRAFT_1057364 [Hymenopellis radicata]
MSSKYSSSRVPTPRTPFEIFYDHMQRRPSIPESQKTSSYAAHRWSQMSEADRKPWVELATQEKRHGEGVTRGGMGIPSYGRGSGDRGYEGEPRVRSTSDPSDPLPIPYDGYAPKDELDLRHARPDVAQGSSEMTYGWAVDPRETDKYFHNSGHPNDEMSSLQNWDFSQSPLAGFTTTVDDYGTLANDLYMPFPGMEDTRPSSRSGGRNTYASNRYGH